MRAVTSAKRAVKQAQPPAIRGNQRKRTEELDLTAIVEASDDAIMGGV